MKIMSWNILAAEWIKKSYYPTIDKKILFNRRARFTRILKTIKEENADIILLQEVMQLEYNSLKSNLQAQYTFSPLIPIQWQYSNSLDKNKKNESGNITLIRKKHFPPDIAIKHYPLPFGVYTQLSNTLSVFNIHLDDLTVQARNKQIKSIEPLLYSSKKTILGGDFNQTYRTNSHLYNLSEFTVHNIDCPTYYIEQKMNIDNIMTRGFDFKKEKTSSSSKCSVYPESIEEGFEKYGSDHLPVIIRV
jgi:endonuclease/exonuclease/phosphatase family metal-dependent hydrolase